MVIDNIHKIFRGWMMKKITQGLVFLIIFGGIYSLMNWQKVTRYYEENFATARDQIPALCDNNRVRSALEELVPIVFPNPKGQLIELKFPNELVYDEKDKVRICRANLTFKIKGITNGNPYMKADMEYTIKTEKDNVWRTFVTLGNAKDKIYINTET